MPAPRQPDDGYLDAWLQRALSERFAPVSNEALPAELARLLSPAKD